MRALPSLVFLDSKGEVVSVLKGVATPESIRKAATAAAAN